MYKPTRREFIKKSSLAAIAVGMGPTLLPEFGHAQASNAPENTPAAKRPKITNDTPPINRIPYLSTYFINPKAEVGKEIVINYYITDFDQKDYMQDDFSETFTVDYWVNGVKSTLSNVKIGDNSFKLNPLPKGKVLFALQATDKQGRKSHRLYQEFLVIDPKEQIIPEDKVYHPDLKKFSIFNDNSHPIETTAGLTAMLQWAVDNGYRKVVLPKGTYRLDENDTVQMASNLTLDMNGSTFKLNPNALNSTMMFEMVKCFDSHVVNGTFEGDLKEHDFEKATNNSEWVHAVGLGLSAEYCSYENIKVVDVTGYGTNTYMGNEGGEVKLPFTAARPKQVGKFVPGNINEKGEVVPSSERTTNAEPVDISDSIAACGFIQLGKYLGYQGNPAGNWVYKASFYDADQKFIESIEGFMYRRLYPPKNAKFARFTLFSDKTPEDLYVFNFLQPYNCAFVNVHHENIRCVGMAPSGFTNLLVEGCSFKNCGQKSARCAFDAEDGWDMMQDLTFRNNVFEENPHNEFLTCDGLNFVVENNVMKAHMWDRTKSTVFRNNTFKAASFYFGTRNRTGYPRIFNNTSSGGVSTKTQTEEPDVEFCIRDCICGNGAASAGNKAGVTATFFFKCKISDGGLNAKVVECDVKNIKNLGGGFEAYNSTIENGELFISRSTSILKGCKVNNSQLRTQIATFLLEDNQISETSMQAGGDWSPEHEWILIGNKITTDAESLLTVGNSFKQVALKNNVITSTNPGFSAVLLVNPTDAKLTEPKVALANNTFNSAGGIALNVVRKPNPDKILTVYLFENKLNGIEEINSQATEMTNVQILRTAPPAEMFEA